ncbi:serine/threonine protein kinase [Mycolicibacterium moriokaense]|uniref:non-specific serine/threonine protein kinase n=2 Tax=Mycolicibacterium moriokaense TaxID=39691 RepID=A0AAD1HC14_9MYCO|nr:serine/threonine protein kinase [Mycolicibacterium moriokaense]
MVVHLGHRDAEQIGDSGQVVDGLAGVKNIVGGRNAAHATESRSPGPTRNMSLMETHQQSGPLDGTVLDGRYRVDAVIATGGTSTVYRGLDLRLDRPVALKVMESRYAGDEQFLTRFQREARAVARLSDPGLVAVYDQGIDHRHPFLVMELIEGGTLRELLRERGPMPPHAAAAVLAPVLNALAVAHAAGLVHRDIKPENVLISDTGDVKIADFGLVRAIAEAKITSSSVILGTAAYLSPEQVSTGDADPRSDVYAMGILTYELLTGTTPFTGDSTLAVAYQRLDHDVPAPGTVIAGVPRQFDQLVLHATDRDPAGRYADARDMADDLAAIVDELGLPAFRVPAPSNSAQHAAALTAATAARKPVPDRQVPPQHTRELTRDGIPPQEPEYEPVSRQFAGVDLEEFYWARQRSKRVLTFWVIAVITLTGLVAAGAWTLGGNISALL